MTRSRRAALASLVAACALPVIWPGDIPFINDEPMLVINAVRANRAGSLAEMGLRGTFGFTYGPFPTWVYQALTAITHDLVVLSALHAALLAATTAGALWWLSRSLRLWPWFAVVPLLSPYFWFFARLLWDNPFLIPLGALAIAGYAAQLSSESSWGLRVAVAAMIAGLLVHLMSIALVVPLGLHMVAVRGRALWQHRISIAVIVLGGVGLAWPYWHSLAAHPTVALPRAPSIDGVLFPIFGGELLSASRLERFVGTGALHGAGLNAAVVVSCLAYPLVWAGFVLAARGIVGAVRWGEWTARTHIATILLGALACQAAIGAMSGKFGHSQYYHGTWIVFTLLAWVAIDFLVERRGRIQWGGIAITGLLATALLATVVTIAVRLHRSHGTRGVYGPTISNQQRVARTIARFSPSSRVVPHVSLYKRYPHTLAILRELNPGPPGDRLDSDADVRYASDDPASGAIEVVRRR